MASARPAGFCEIVRGICVCRTRVFGDRSRQNGGSLSESQTPAMAEPAEEARARNRNPHRIGKSPERRRKRAGLAGATEIGRKAERRRPPRNPYGRVGISRISALVASASRVRVERARFRRLPIGFGEFPDAPPFPWKRAGAPAA